MALQHTAELLITTETSNTEDKKKGRNPADTHIFPYPQIIDSQNLRISDVKIRERIKIVLSG